MARRRTLVAAGTVTALVAALGIAQLAPGAAPVARAEGLTPYAGCGDLLSHYRQALRAQATPWGAGSGGFGGFALGGPAMDMATGGVAASAPRQEAKGSAAGGSAGGGAVGNGGTGTNLQEQGVDEPDLAKLSDGRLVVLAQNRLQIMSAEADPRLLGSRPLGTAKQPYVSGELLIAGNRALVVTSAWREEPTPQTSSRSADRMMMIYRPGTPTTRLILLDVSSDTPRLLEEATYDGNYVSARLTGQTVRLITNNRPQVTSTQPQYNQQPTPAQQRAAEREALAANQQSAEAVSLTDVLPQVTRRNAGGTVLGTGSAVTCSQTSYAPGSAGDSTLLVTTLRPSVGLAATDSDAITTDGDLVYASENRLYVATSRWGTSAAMGGPPTEVMVDPAVSSDSGTEGSIAEDEAQKRPAQDPSATPTATTTPSPTASPTDEVTTDLHAFDVSGEATRYIGSGAVPGYVLGRWALSEDKGVLRVATTRQPPWQQANPRGQQAQTSSMLVKLTEQDGKLVETGRVEGLGKTERIQAVRYFGDLAAVVTFRQTDPLYLVDLAGDPKVLGELKVNGFSTYLHPLGDGLLMGLGQEADDQGRITGTQVSVFDISDPANPRQVDRLQLGTGYSPAQDDSRAFSYDPKRRMAMFAFSAYDVRGYQGPVGALGIAVGATGQLTRVGLLEVAQNAPTARVLYDADHVYAVSDSGVAAGDPATMTRTGQADFARADNNGVGSTEPAPALKR